MENYHYIINSIDLYVKFLYITNNIAENID